MLPGITRIELDGQVTDGSMRPWVVAMTPGGDLLYGAVGGGWPSVAQETTPSP